MCGNLTLLICEYCFHCSYHCHSAMWLPLSLCHVVTIVTLPCGYHRHNVLIRLLPILHPVYCDISNATCGNITAVSLISCCRFHCGGGGVDPIPCVSTHRISDPRSGPAQLLPPHVKQRSHPHGVRPQIPDR